MMQKEFLLNLCQSNPDAIIIGSLGTIAKDLDSIDHKHKIIVRGAMGCVMGVGLGYAMNTDKEVIVVLGEGSFLMKMGSIATILRHKPSNLSIYIIDNGCFKSCGGQTNNFFFVPPPPPPFQIIKCMV